jgi:hypothetical protein
MGPGESIGTGTPSNGLPLQEWREGLCIFLFHSAFSIGYSFIFSVLVHNFIRNAPYALTVESPTIL